MMINIEEIFLELEKSIKLSKFKGHDPYDALINKKFLTLPKTARLLVTLFFRFSHVDLRSLFRITKSHNPKALALLLSSYLKSVNIIKRNFTKEIDYLAINIIRLRSLGYSGFCCGYNFPWQNRERLLPAYTPTLVNTVYASHSLLDYFEQTDNVQIRDLALSSSDFLLNDLHKAEVSPGISLSYSPFEKNVVHNANALAASLLSRCYSITKKEIYKETSLKLISLLISEQKPDGSWSYSIDLKTGEEKNQLDWHQGFILQSLKEAFDYLNLVDKEHEKVLIRGLDFYEKQFTFEGEGFWRYPQKYPINIHNQAQGIITFSLLNKYNSKSKEISYKILDWTYRNLHSKSGYFYYQKGKFFKNKINYMRWNQAWMLYALVSYMETWGKQNEANSKK